MRRSRAFGSQNGNAILEFALVSIVVIPLFLGVFQFGYSMYMYNSLVAAVRAGTRYASLADINNAGDGSEPTAFDTAVQNMVVYGTPSTGTTAVVPGLAVTQVTPTITFQATTNVPTAVSVKINSFTINAVVTSITITNKPIFTMPYFGKYCSSGTLCP
jgi:Flp pilus assembly protein TadG